MQIYTVNTLNDCGSGSLRDGILYANSNSKTKIVFDITGLSKNTKNNTLTYNFINVNILFIPGPHKNNVFNYSKNNYVYANNMPYT